MHNSLALKAEPFFKPHISSKQEHAHHFIEDLQTGTVVCDICGLVKEENVICPEWSLQSNFHRKEYSKPSFSSKLIESPNLVRAFKLNKNINWKLKRIYLGEKEIKRLTSQYEINSAIESRALYIFHKSISHSIFKNHYINLLATICLYYCCKSYGFPITLKELLDNVGYSTRLALKYYTRLMQTLKLPYPQKSISSTLNQYSTQMELSWKEKKKANEILEIYKKEKFCGGIQIKGIVAAVLYFTCLIERIPKSQQEIASAINISEITLRARFREIQLLCKQGKISY